MNDDFRKAANTPGDGVGVDTRIQFELAKRTPMANPPMALSGWTAPFLQGYEEGGIRKEGGFVGADESDVKGMTTWYGEDYINIFVVTEINDNDGLGAPRALPTPVQRLMKRMESWCCTTYLDWKVS